MSVDLKQPGPGLKFNRLVIAAYRLPYKFVKHKQGYKTVQNSGGLVSAILSVSENLKKNNSSFKNKVLWAGIAENIPENQASVLGEKTPFDIIPVKIQPKLNDLYYGGFCNNLIWPLFHYFSSYCVFNPSYFTAYTEANSKFCDAIVKIIRPGDFLWIHDYQLLLLPEMIRKLKPDVTIGFFLHIPFPSFEIFRLLPRQWRETVINGMLGADLIGFHTHDYAQLFIKSVKRTTGYECQQNVIFTPDNLVKADAFPIGIDYDTFHSASMLKPVIALKSKTKKVLSGQKLIFSVDRLDYSKGLVLRLQGYETFLETYPNWNSRVVFNMVIVPSRDRIEKYKEMKTEIESMVGRINGKYSTLSWRPIIYQYKSLSFNEMVALYDVSDVGLITPMRDGMNLVAKEYIACQVESQGVLILSEMAGAAAELSEALIINPVDKMEMAEAIHTALEMKLSEKRNRLERMQNRISSYNVFTWAFDFLHQTMHIKDQQKSMHVKMINTGISAQIAVACQKSHKRIYFIDYDGTLVSLSRFPEQAVIEISTLKIIERLCANQKNHVVIVSGRDRNFLERQFKDLPVALVAEHGYYIRKYGGEWKTTVLPVENWKETIIPIMQEYVNRCNGTFIEEKSGSIAWHYRNADSDFAELRLHELRDDLAEIIRYKTDFEILEGYKVLEVKSGKYDKGQAAASFLKDARFDFILAAGDDTTDEFLFKIMPETAFTVRVGLKASFARYNVTNLSGLLTLLNALSKE